MRIWRYYSLIRTSSVTPVNSSPLTGSHSPFHIKKFVCKAMFAQSLVSSNTKLKENAALFRRVLHMVNSSGVFTVLL